MNFLRFLGVHEDHVRMSSHESSPFAFPPSLISNGPRRTRTDPWTWLPGVAPPPAPLDDHRPRRPRKRTAKKEDKKEEPPKKIFRNSRVPENEWKLISEAAAKVNYNSSLRCQLGDKCRFKHLCVVCGAPHPMTAYH